jgi:predicted DNA binding CopG/RHH family protein
MVSKAREKATRKYLQKLDDVIFRVKKGRKAEIKAHAESLGMSLNAYINYLIDKDMGSSD